MVTVNPGSSFEQILKGTKTRMLYIKPFGSGEDVKGFLP